MGILDDAIREHLDLKRKHGARDAELQQLEDEAFGPPTRPDEPDFPERPPTGEEDVVVAEAATEEGLAEPAVEEAEPFAPAEPSGEADSPFFDQEIGPAEATLEPEPAVGAPPGEHPAPEPEAAEVTPAPEATPLEDEVAEVAPAEEPPELEPDEEFEEFREGEGEEGEEGEDDVLEETPEFLRDTPENERLWFEQGEPQDFDFDDEDREED